MAFLELSLEAWNTIGTWFSAVATTTLAVVALLIATREKRPMLEVSAQRQIIMADSAGRLFAADRAFAEEGGFRGEPAIEIQVTNIGHRGVLVTGVYWRVPWAFRRKTIKAALYQTSPINELTDEMPWRLADGHSARQVHPENDFGTLNKDQWARLRAGLRWKWAATRFMKVGAVTTVGRPVERRLSKGMVALMRELIGEGGK